MDRISELLTAEQAVAKFPNYMREIYESNEFNRPYESLVAVYHYFSPDADTWDIDQWTLCYNSGYGTGLHVVDVWKHAQSVPEITSFYITKELFERLREVA